MVDPVVRERNMSSEAVMAEDEKSHVDICGARTANRHR